MISNEDILKYLIDNRNEKYMNFTSSLVPNSSNMLGVKIPDLRKFAKRIAKENSIIDYLKNAKDDYFEETMLQGLVIGYSNMDIDTVISCSKKFVPKINNWSICDSFCNSLKISKKYPDKMWEYIISYKNSKSEFELRFLLVMCLSHFITDKYIKDIFKIIESIKSNDYYVEMAIAWLVSTCYIKYRDETLKYLKCCSISNFAYNKSIQKIIESYRVSDENKEMLRKMKKKN